MDKPPPTLSLPARCVAELDGKDETIAFAVGPERAVYVLQSLGAYSPGRAPPPYRARAWLDGQCLLDVRIESPSCRLYTLQPLGADLLFVGVPLDRAGEGARNGRVYSRDGRPLRELHLGAGIEYVQTTREGAIWTGYFDEGVFGDDPVSQHGLAAWNGDGECVYRFQPDLAGLDTICDCYALNVADDRETWAYYYTQFPLVLLRGHRVARYWNVPIRGAHAFAARGEHALFTGGYREHDTLALLKLGEAEQCAILAHFRVCDDEGAPLPAERFHGRGDALYFQADARIWTVELDQALAALA